ncbi:MAG: hypothetical protein MK100_07180, partial [Phycisphaerales bacterium]|nr:hypothetical protein [Phycisphaerales bacterium]
MKRSEVKAMSLIATAMLSVCGLARAATWNVDDDGPADFDNIQEAIDASSAGDLILVAPGTYTSTQMGAVVDMKGKAVTLRATAATAIIDGQDSRRGIDCISAENVDTIIEGFMVIGCDGGGIMCANSSATITNCVVTGSAGEYGGGILLSHSNSV